MSSIPIYVNYQIVIQDPTEYAFALSCCDANGFFQKSPRYAANLFAIPFPYPSGNLADIPKTILFISPGVPGSEILFPGPTGINYDDTVDTQTIPGQAGNPASIWPAGPDGVFTWCGVLRHINGNQSGVTLSDLAQRAWAVGFEALNEVQNTNTNSFIRDASRTLEGMGFAVRNESTTKSVAMLIGTELGQTPVDLFARWERFYIRVRYAFPTNDTYFWFMRGTTSPTTNQLRLRIDALGTLTLVNFANPTNTVLATSITPLALDTWYKIDLMVNLNSGSGGRVRGYINGQNYCDVVPAANGLFANTGTGIVGSILGVGSETAVGTFNTLCLDMDDWVNAEIPLVIGNSIDFLSGSHIMPVHATGVGPLNSGGWVVNDANFLNCEITGLATILSSNVNVTSSTSGAVLNYVTDAEDVPLTPALIVGVQGGNILSTVVNADATTTGAQGYTIAGVATTAPSPIAAGIFRVAYSPTTPTTTPVSIVPFGVYRLKGTNATGVVLNGVQAFLEYIGVFGHEDDFFNQVPPIPIIYHNAPYYNTLYAVQGPSFDCPVGAVGGTYTGATAGVTVTLPAPCHWLMIRNVSTPAVPVLWWPTKPGGQSIATLNINDAYVIRMWTDATSGDTFFSVTGANAQVNTNGATYQYIAYCDPGMRYNLCGSFRQQQVAGAAVAGVVPLFNSAFTPFGGFVWRDSMNNQASATTLYFKGPGNSSDDATLVTGTQLSSAWNYSIAGQLNIGTAINNLSELRSYSMFRLDDGSGGVVVQIGTYTGNGSSPRNITLTPTSGRFPLFALVMPSTGSNNAIWRDPSHAGTASSNFTSGGAVAANGISAGAIDRITVGSQLNANGVVYQYFVFPGDTNAWNNGSFNTPGAPGSGFPTPGPPNISGPSVVGDGGLEFNGSPAITLLQDISGIYTLVPGKTNDTYHDTQTGQTSIDLAIPEPSFKTGYIGG